MREHWLYIYNHIYIWIYIYEYIYMFSIAFGNDQGWLWKVTMFKRCSRYTIAMLVCWRVISYCLSWKNTMTSLDQTVASPEVTAWFTWLMFLIALLMGIIIVPRKEHIMNYDGHRRQHVDHHTKWYVMVIRQSLSWNL
jgi:hypothetical protein